MRGPRPDISTNGYAMRICRYTIFNGIIMIIIVELAVVRPNNLENLIKIHNFSTVSIAVSRHRRRRRRSRYDHQCLLLADGWAWASRVGERRTNVKSQIELQSIRFCAQHVLSSLPSLFIFFDKSRFASTSKYIHTDSHKTVHWIFTFHPLFAWLCTRNSLSPSSTLCACVFFVFLTQWKWKK